MDEMISSEELKNLEDPVPEQENEQQDRKNAQSIDKQISLKGKIIYRAKVVHSNATQYCIQEGDLQLKPGDYVILPTQYGRDLGLLQGIITNLLEVDQHEVVTMIRKASDKDLTRSEENKEKDKKAFEICKQKSMEHNLEMKLVSAHHLLDESKILFFFTADSRVDFRELVKDLVAIFRTRIELRQIGVRDESRVLGGMGMCGRGFCCNTITDHLNPVSIKMAKEQNLSLNSLKISGACGRLLCCLSYEYPFYKNLKDKLPAPGARISLDAVEYVVDDVNIFTKKIRLRSASGQLEIDFAQFYYDSAKSRWCIKQQ